MWASILDAELRLHAGCIPSTVFKVALTLLNIGGKIYDSCSICFCEVQPSRVDVNTNDPARARCFSYSHAEQSNRTTSRNRNGLTGTQVTNLVDDVDAHVE